MEKVLSKKEIVINRSEANFNKACELALDQAVRLFNIDDCGHSDLKGWERNCCSVEIEFVKYRGSYSSHNYIFKALAVKNMED